MLSSKGESSRWENPRQCACGGEVYQHITLEEHYIGSSWEWFADCDSCNKKYTPDEFKKLKMFKESE